MTEVANQTNGTDSNGIFLAYDKVLYAQYADYVQYATMTPGAEAMAVARSIRSEAYTDATVKSLNESLRMVVDNGPTPIEYSMIVIRDVSGDLFDLYFMDEDSLFIACAAHIAHDEVIPMAQHLAATVGVTYQP